MYHLEWRNLTATEVGDGATDLSSKVGDSNEGQDRSNPFEKKVERHIKTNKEYSFQGKNRNPLQ